jgi:hypothetical protein
VASETILPPWVVIDDATCSRVQKSSVQNAFSQMLDIAEVAYDRTTTARRDLGLNANKIVVSRTITSYFAIYTHPQGARTRLTNLIGRCLWMAVFDIMQLTS